MIQRVQSVYLFLTTVISVLFMTGNILKYTDRSGQVINITAIGLLRVSDGSPSAYAGRFIPLLLLTVMIAGVSLLTIFLYKNRSLQLKLTISLLILAMLVMILTGMYSVQLIGIPGTEISLGIKMILPVLMLIFLYLAYRGIKKDDDIIKSYDRLR